MPVLTSVLALQPTTDRGNVVDCACSVPGVVELCGTADDASNIYLVFQPCFGGDLYKRLAHRGLYEEAQLCKEV
jgi:hypothetical protein